MGGHICSIAVADSLPAAGLVLISPIRCIRRAGPTSSASSTCPSFDLPCLFVSGTRDAFGTPPELEAHTAAIPGPVEHVSIEAKATT